mgnify:CR=1 FL=1
MRNNINNRNAIVMCSNNKYNKYNNKYNKYNNKYNDINNHIHNNMDMLRYGYNSGIDYVSVLLLLYVLLIMLLFTPMASFNRKRLYHTRNQKKRARK